MTGVLVSCGDASAADNVPKECGIFAMDTYMSLKAYGDGAEAALESAQERITALENELSVTITDSDISRINSSAGSPVEVSEDAVILASAGKEYGELTAGALDITVYPVLKEWGFTTGEYHIPDSQKIAELLQKVDYRRISVSGNTVQIPEGFQIDFGALAKGYTGDEIMEIFRENGVKSGLVSLGGNIQTLGTKPDGSFWKVAVKDPFYPDEQMCILDIADKAVITSGSYERFFTGDDGKDYWHIIDPKDGYPADNGLVSVTVIGDSGLMCDALSTALFSAGTSKSVEYWQDNGGFDMILVTDEQKILYTDGIADSITLKTDMPAEVIAHD